MTRLDKVIIVLFIITISLLCVSLYHHTRPHPISYNIATNV